MRILLIGLVYVFIGCHQIARYDKAEPSDSSIDAQIVDALGGDKSLIDSDSDTTIDSATNLDTNISPICGNSKIEFGEECDGGECCTSMCLFASIQTLCRDAKGLCDEKEYCTGSSASCPLDTLKSATTICRAETDICDKKEFCTGTSAICPDDIFQPNTTICRQAAGDCDIAEVCSGASTDCPTDSYLADGTRCNFGLGHCLNGSCQSLPQTSSIILHLPLDGDATSIIGTYTITDKNNYYRPDGKINKSAYFVGSYSKYIDVSDLDFSGSYTISVWAKRNPAIQNYAQIFETGEGWDSSPQDIDGLDLHLTDTAPRVFYLFTPNYCGTADFQDQNDSQWYHYVITFDSSTKVIKSYLDGSSSDTVTCSILGSHQGLTLGANAFGFNNFHGYIDELIVWNKVLTEVEVQTLHTSQK